MRRMMWVIAVLVLAGCGERDQQASKKPQAPVVSTQNEAAAPQWDVLVQGSTPQAVSDLAGWLIEHSFVSYVVTREGKQQVLVGPFSSRAEAEAKQAVVSAALVKAKKQNIETLVIEHSNAE